MLNKLMFAALAIISLAGSALLYELHHIWPFNAGQISLLRALLAVSLLAVVGAWIFYPSRILVSVILIAMFTISVLISRSGVTGAYAATAIVMVALAALATHLRRNLA